MEDQIVTNKRVGRLFMTITLKINRKIVQNKPIFKTCVSNTNLPIYRN